MRTRTIGLAAAALLALPLMASCRNPGTPGGGRPTTTMPGGGGGGAGDVPGPAAGQKDCGTINKADPVTAAEQAVVTCFNNYHAYSGVYLKIVDGSSVIVFQATGHAPIVSRYTMDNSGHATLVKRTACGNGAQDPRTQFLLNASGNLTSICQF